MADSLHCYGNGKLYNYITQQCVDNFYNAITYQFHLATKPSSCASHQIIFSTHDLCTLSDDTIDNKWQNRGFETAYSCSV